MKCPYCENEESRVIDSRHTEDGHAILEKARMRVLWQTVHNI